MLKLENREFGCSCNADKNCQYEEFCKMEVLQHIIWNLEKELQNEKDKNIKYKIYYAHHIWKYNTEVERYEIELIRNKFNNSIIINPNGEVLQERDESEIMKDCLDYVKECDILVFSSLSGVVGKGVVTEVKKALDTGKRVYYIRDNGLYLAEYPKFKEIGVSNRVFAIVSNV